MNKDCILVIDAGTGSVRASLIDADGRIISFTSRDWSYESKPEAAPQAVEFPAEIFWQMIMEIIKELINSSDMNLVTIVGLSVTSQRHGMVFIDKAGTELYSGPNLDLRGAQALPELLKNEESIVHITGHELHGMNGLARISWFKVFMPDVYRNVDKILMFADWVCYKLTGQVSSEPSIACSSQMFDIHTLDYSGNLMRELEIREDIFPEVSQAHESIGTVLPSVAQFTGLPSGIPVFNAGGDTQLGALGMGMVSPGDYGVIAGSTTPVITLINSSNVYPSTGIETNNYTMPGMWCLEANAGSTGLSLRWVKELLASLLEHSPIPYELINELASEVPIGSGGLNAFLGTEISGIKSNEGWGGIVFKVPWNIDDVKVNQLLRATIESNLYSVYANINHITAVSNVIPQEIYLCGGQSRAQIFSQGLADLTSLPVKTFENAEASSLGAGIVAAIGLGIYQTYPKAIKGMVRIKQVFNPNKDNTNKFRVAFQIWLNLFNQLGTISIQ